MLDAPSLVLCSTCAGIISSPLASTKHGSGQSTDWLSINSDPGNENPNMKTMFLRCRRGSAVSTAMLCYYYCITAFVILLTHFWQVIHSLLRMQSVNSMGCRWSISRTHMYTVRVLWHVTRLRTDIVCSCAMG